MSARVNWGAIFAGAFIGLAAMVFFSLFAMATGINGVNVLVAMSPTISFGAALYSVGCSILSFALAGYSTVRLADLRAPGAACLHALSAFSLAASLVPYLFTRTILVGAPGFAVAPATSLFFSAGLSWTLFLSFGLAAVSACAGGVQASYREGSSFGESGLRRAA